jgi:response regulator of citrate/malate metabolism
MRVKKILIIEDDKSIAELERDYLEFVANCWCRTTDTCRTKILRVFGLVLFLI